MKYHGSFHKVQTVVPIRMVRFTLHQLPKEEGTMAEKFEVERSSTVTHLHEERTRS
jgi:hypothetical protein